MKRFLITGALFFSGLAYAGCERLSAGPDARLGFSVGAAGYSSAAVVRLLDDGTTCRVLGLREGGSSSIWHNFQPALASQAVIDHESQSLELHVCREFAVKYSDYVRNVRNNVYRALEGEIFELVFEIWNNSGGKLKRPFLCAPELFKTN